MRYTVGDTAECVCGAEIRYVRIPHGVPSLRGRKHFWLGIPASRDGVRSDGDREESHLCYPGSPGPDGRALHEPDDPESVHKAGEDA